MKQAMYRGPSASSLTGSGSSTDTLTGSGLNSSSAPDLLSKGRTSRCVSSAFPDKIYPAEQTTQQKLF